MLNLLRVCPINECMCTSMALNRPMLEVSSKVSFGGAE